MRCLNLSAPEPGSDPFQRRDVMLLEYILSHIANWSLIVRKRVKR